uniref:SRCR domain-containing protein n=1 Tax=Steinernema glaseri TaxID=37863 RepID=A0A1I7ZMP9_9BILA
MDVGYLIVQDTRISNNPHIAGSQRLQCSYERSSWLQYVQDVVTCDWNASAVSASFSAWLSFAGAFGGRPN